MSTFKSFIFLLNRVYQKQIQTKFHYECPLHIQQLLSHLISFQLEQPLATVHIPSLCFNSVAIRCVSFSTTLVKVELPWNNKDNDDKNHKTNNDEKNIHD